MRLVLETISVDLSIIITGSIIDTLTVKIDEQIIQKFMDKLTLDIGSTWSAVLVYIGDKLGLYKAMLDMGGPITSDELATLTGTSERYIREWLANQAAGGYIIFDPVLQKYNLPIEHAYALVDDKTPGCAIGAFQVAMSLFKDEHKILDAFRSGKGIEWSDRNEDLFHGTERYFKPVYTNYLTTSWIPSLEGVEKKLKSGCKVADVGCGHGISTTIMAKAYPNSAFFGFDYHASSIERARKIAELKRLEKDRVIFEVASSTDFNGRDYDLVTLFACLHDMGDPIGTVRHILRSLKPDGTLMIIEPFANDKLEDNLNPRSRIFYATSTLICIPTSLAQNGPALGAQAGTERIKEIVQGGGFKHFKCTAFTPYNMVFEARA
jgi:SAM-dependent methyltransferase